jgi:Protein of unknown function (DUF1045)
VSDGGAWRYAVYFAPASEHPLWQAGCSWLGRDPSQVPAPPPASPAVRSPWRYGWHATLKAPIQLRDGECESRWLDAVATLAAEHGAFEMPTLHVAQVDDFLALSPERLLEATHPLRRLADRCVVDLDGWRAPLTPAERQRQSWPGMSTRQLDQVDRYGYAHVLDDWRFHMTLSDSVTGWPAAQVADLRGAAQTHFELALTAPLRCEALCVFVEPTPGAPFELRHRFPLASA